MRISTPVFYQRSVSNVLDQQGTLSQHNQHLSASKRVLSGADDPVAIATIQRLNQDISTGEQYLENAGIAESANMVEDTALRQVTNVLQRVRELTVSASNDTFNDGDRQLVATELDSLRDELIGVANTKDGNSQYIFAGFEVDTQPYQRNEFGDIAFHGDEGTRSYKVGSAVNIQGYDSGESVFAGIGEGNGTFVSEIGRDNKGSGILSEGRVVDHERAEGFLAQDYTISISDIAGVNQPEYSVYGLDASAATSDASVSIASIDLADSAIDSVNPKGFYPAGDSAVYIDFVASADAQQFELTINGQSAVPAAIYDATNSNAQTLSVNGIAIEVDGIPNAGDQYALTKYIEPTAYEEGQAISFNGINTELKGEVVNLDNFTLRQSGEKDIFTTIQDAITALHIEGDHPSAAAQRAVAMESALLEVDAAIGNVGQIHTKVGTRLNSLESQRESTLDFNLTNQKALSNLEDLDMAAAISEFQLENSMLEVSQQTFMKMQSLSLFEHM